jgi:murein DD-endopeptidase MepM/ murein hydrolase activator NlpD
MRFWRRNCPNGRLGALATILAGYVFVACADHPPLAAGTAGSDILLNPDTVEVSGQVPRDATLENLLRDNGLAASTANAVIASVRKVFDPRNLKAAQPFTIVSSIEGVLRLFEYEIDADRFLRITAIPGLAGELSAEVLPIPKTLEQTTAAGVIAEATPSLYQAMGSTGETPELTLAMAAIFAGEIDFNTELRLDDRFAVAFEKYTRDGHAPTYGTITAAEFQNDGRVVRAIRFAPPGGEPGYYDDQGNSMKRFFLRSPLPFEPRITSGFSTRRFHPVTGGFRPHLGVDYGAPTGTRIQAVADGRVISVTTDAANGRMVRLQHTQDYQTYYLHLSRFADGIRPGARVMQEQIIGYVGQSGLVTGPHLDYRIRKNGVFVNPLIEQRNMPPGDPIPDTALDAFRIARDQALAQLQGALASIPVPANLPLRAD